MRYNRLDSTLADRSESGPASSIQPITDSATSSICSSADRGEAVSFRSVLAAERRASANGPFLRALRPHLRVEERLGPQRHKSPIDLVGVHWVLTPDTHTLRITARSRGRRWSSGGYREGESVR